MISLSNIDILLFSSIFNFSLSLFFITYRYMIIADDYSDVLTIMPLLKLYIQ